MFKSTPEAGNTTGRYHYSRKEGKFPPRMQDFFERAAKNPRSGKLVFVKYMLSLRTSAHTGVAIPRLVRKCSENRQEGWDSPRFLVVIATWFLSTGGLPHQSADWFAMTGNLKAVWQTPIRRSGRCKFKEILNWGRLIFGGSLYMIDGNKVITRRLRRNVK